MFVKNGASWQQQAYVKASNTNVDATFGSAVALSADGNTMVVGSDGEWSNATGVGGVQTDQSARGAGAAYVFTRSGTTWTQQAYIKASNSEAGDAFGISVALASDGNTLAVSATSEDSNATGVGGVQTNNSASSAGAVYVFTRSANIWTQQAYVKASNTAEDTDFGYALSLSGDGNTLAVGAYGDSSTGMGVNGTQTGTSVGQSGAAYVFTRSGTTWSQQTFLKASNPDSEDYFGHWLSVSSDGNTLAVGADQEASNAKTINGNQSDNSLQSVGAVYVFARAGATWSQQAYVKASNGSGDHYFGRAGALSADGNLLAVGAVGESSNATGIGGDQSNTSDFGAGAVYVFTRSESTSTWAQQEYVKASNPASEYNFGGAITVSGDGTELIVGSNSEASNAVGIGGSQTDMSDSDAGAAYAFGPGTGS